MPHTTPSPAPKTRTTTHRTPARPGAPIHVMPLWQGLGLLFAPAKPERP